MPESTLTPAPVITATFPGAKKEAIRSMAAAGLIVLDDVDARTLLGNVGTDIRMTHASPVRYPARISISLAATCT